jgi:hypothetical protein
MNDITLGRRALAEAIGTFALVFAGCGAIVTDAQRDGALGVVGFGLVCVGVALTPAGAYSAAATRHRPPLRGHPRRARDALPSGRRGRQCDGVHVGAATGWRSDAPT